MKVSCVLLVPLVVGAIGCQGDQETPKPLCDPMDATAGRVALENADGGLLPPGLAMLYDNGAAYLFVDGQCHYWANDPSQPWEETRTGVLDADTAAQLGASLHFGAWDDLRGTWENPGSIVADGPTLIFDNAQHAVVCVSRCEGPTIPTAVTEMSDELVDDVQGLWDRGAAADSALRVLAVASDPGPGIPYVDWPLARPISDFTSTSPAPFGQGILEDDPASVQALKDLRRSFLRGDHGAFVWNMLPVTSGGADYQLYVRDALPFEDAHGLVPLSPDLDMH